MSRYLAPAVAALVLFTAAACKPSAPDADADAEVTFAAPVPVEELADDAPSDPLGDPLAAAPAGTVGSSGLQAPTHQPAQAGGPPLQGQPLPAADAPTRTRSGDGPGDHGASGSGGGPSAGHDPVAVALAAVAESGAELPAFPLVTPPNGLEEMYGPAASNVAMDREHMVVGDRVVALEGRVFRQRYRLTGGARDYSQAEFQRYHRDAVAALGGAQVNRVQFTREVNAAFGGRKQVDVHYHGACASHGCDNQTYLVRRAGQEFWLLVSSGGIPLHGQVTVLQRGSPPATAVAPESATDGRAGELAPGAAR